MKFSQNYIDILEKKLSKSIYYSKEKKGEETITTFPFPSS